VGVCVGFTDELQGYVGTNDVCCAHAGNPTKCANLGFLATKPP
jgi:hypothetical protein